MKEPLYQLLHYETLDQQEAYSTLKKITEGEYSPNRIAGFLSAFIMRQPTLEEIKGFRKRLMEVCVSVSLQEFSPVDIVGTGGDGKNTFNISTLSAIVLAAAGIKIAKHGNYAATSVSGSSDILAYLGYQFTADEDHLKRRLENTNFCFLHAPLFHPVLKNVALIRKEIGLRTLFNLLGPVIHPARPILQILGVSNLAYQRLYAYLMQDLSQNYQIVHTLDGYDEISLTAAFKVISPASEIIYAPEELGFKTILPKSIEAGKNMRSAAAVFMKILEGGGSEAQQNVVIANSGFAMHALHPEKSPGECFDLVKEVLESKKALKTFKKIIENE